MQATKVVIGVFNAVWMPVFMFGLYNQHELFDLKLTDREWQFLMLNITQIVAGVLVLPDVFVKDPVRRSSIAFQLICRFTVILLCIAIPIMSFWVAITVASKQPCFSVFYWFYALVSVLMLYHYWGLSGVRGLRLSDFWTFVD